MSYQLTEAERKSVAVIEDLKLFFERKNEGFVPETILHLTDGDKLDLTCLLPKNKFVITDADDQVARLKLLDEASGFTIECNGLQGKDYFTQENTALGIGWRYGLTFGKDADDFVNEVIFTRLNDGAKVVRTFRKFSDLIIKNLEVGTSTTGGTLKVWGPATFVADTTFSRVDINEDLSVAGATTIAGTLTVNDSAEIAGVTISETTVDAGERSFKAGDTTIESVAAKTFDFGGDTKETSTIKNTDVRVVNSSVLFDDDSLVNVPSANIDALSGATADFTGKAAAGSLEVSGPATIDGDVQLGGRFQCGLVKADETGIAVSAPITIKNSNLNITGDIDVYGNQLIQGSLTASSDLNTSENADIGGILSVHQDATIDGDATIEGDVTISGHTTETTLDVTEKAVIQDGTVNTLKSDNATIDTASVNSLAANELTVAANANISGDLKVTGDIETDDITSSTVTTRKVEAVLVKGVKAEIDFATINDDANVKGDARVSGTIHTDSIKGSAGDSLLKTGKDNINLGSNAKQLVIETTSDTSLSVTDNNYGHIKAVVDNKTQYLATMGDIEKVVNPLGLVDRSSNQEISGQKMFKNIVYAQGGVAVKDDEGNVRNLISHTEDLNNVEQVENPDYVRAIAEKKEYDTAYDAFATVYTEYNEAILARNRLTNSENTLVAAKALLESNKSDNDEAQALKTELTEALETEQNTLKEAEAAKAAAITAKATAEEALEAANDEYTAAKELNDAGDVDNYDLYNISFDDTTLKSQVASFRENPTISAAFSDILSDSTEFTYTEALDEAQNLTIALKAVIKMTSNPDVIESVATSLTMVSNARSVINSQHANTLSTLQKNFNAASKAKTTATENLGIKTQELSDATAFAEAEKQSVLRVTSNLSAATSAAEITAQSVVSAQADVDAAQETVNEDSKSFDVEKAEYLDTVSAYTGTRTTVLDDTFPLPTPEKPLIVKELEAGTIPETIAKGVGDIMYVGDSNAEMQIKSKALAGDDEHIQATIGGHAHLLANLDDVIGDAKIDEISASYDNNTFKLGVTESVIGGEQSSKDVAKVIFGPEFTLSSGGIVTLTDTTITGLNERVNTLEQASQDILTALTDVETTDGALKFTNADGTVDTITVEGTDGTTIETADDKLIIGAERVGTTLTNVVDEYGKLELIEKNQNKLASAVEAKVLHDDAIAKADEIGQRLEQRVPVAPNAIGTYGLRANVISQKGEDTSVTYTWDGTSVLPTADIDNGDTDIEGNILELYTDENPVEYGLKMRIVEVTDSYGNKKKVPQIGWMKLS